MKHYFEPNESAAYCYGGEITQILNLVANKYVRENPGRPPVFRTMSANGFMQNRFYRYLLDFGERFPDAGLEMSAYAWAKLWSDEKKSMMLKAVPYSPMTVTVNGEQVYRSNDYEERNRMAAQDIRVTLEKGWNSCVVQCVKTKLGFGGEFGPANFKGNPLRFFAPTPERESRQGFLYTLGTSDEAAEGASALSGSRWLLQ